MKDNEQDWGPQTSWRKWSSGPWKCPGALPRPSWPCPSCSHSPELSLQIHKVLPGQHKAGAGVDDQGLAELEVGRLEPPLGQLGKGPEPVRRGGGDSVTLPPRARGLSAPSEHRFLKRILRPRTPAPYTHQQCPISPEPEPISKRNQTPGQGDDVGGKSLAGNLRLGGKGQKCESCFFLF